MTKIISTLIIGFLASLMFGQDCVTIDLPNDNIADRITTIVNNANGNPITIRFDIPSDNTNWVSAEIDQNVFLGEGQTLIVPNHLSLELTNGASVNLDGNAKLAGENLGGSRLIIEDSCDGCVVVNTAGCDGCEISDIMIGSLNNNGYRTDPVNAIGIEIVDGPCKVNSVNVQNVQTGIVVSSDNNEFYDLHFLNVAQDLEDLECNADDNDSAAIKIVSSNGNVINNVMHRLSPGAITVWFDGICNNNEILNITVEQEFIEGEDPSCKSPAIYIPNGNINGNTLLGNFNNAKADISVEFCENNNTIFFGDGDEFSCSNAPTLGCNN